MVAETRETSGTHQSHGDAFHASRIWPVFVGYLCLAVGLLTVLILVGLNTGVVTSTPSGLYAQWIVDDIDPPEGTSTIHWIDLSPLAIATYVLLIACLLTTGHWSIGMCLRGVARLFN